MRIVRYSHQGEVGFGVHEDETVAEISPHPFGAFEYTGQRLPAVEVRLLAPVLPSKVVAVGRNYAEHARELGNEVPPTPVLFLKPSTSVIGPGDPIVRPSGVGRVDYEGELAAVVGHLVRRLDRVQRRLHLSEAQLARSREALADGGNRSSATVLFILEAMLGSGEVGAGQWLVGLAFGTGLTLEALLLRT